MHDLNPMPASGSLTAIAAGGHGYGKDNLEVATFAALGTAFLQHHTGWHI
jgi:hypothetical protein